MDGVALSAVLASSVVGLAGVASSVIISVGERSHHREQAARERQQDRLQESYLGLLEFVRLTNVFLEGRWAPGDHGWWPAPGEPPKAADYEFMAARVDAYGTPAVRSAMASWWGSVRQALDHGGQLGRISAVGAEGSESWEREHEAYLEAFYGPVQSATEQLIELANAELREGA